MMPWPDWPSIWIRMRETWTILLRFLFRLTISLSSGGALTVLLITLITYFFPDPTDAKWPAGQHADLAKVHLRPIQQEEPVRRPIQLPTATKEVAQQTPSPAADIRNLPASKPIAGRSAQEDSGVRSNADASEQQRPGPEQVPETSPERGRVLPVSATIDNPRNLQDQELLQVAPGALSEQNGLTGAARATVISQNDNSTMATAADDGTKIAPAGQAPSGAPYSKIDPIQRGRALVDRASSSSQRRRRTQTEANYRLQRTFPSITGETPHLHARMRSDLPAGWHPPASARPGC
jgi:hypothetical protein